MSLRLGAPCDQRCAPCDCRESAPPVDAEGVPTALRGGGARLELRGEPARDPAFERTLAAAAAAGWAEVWVRTNGRAFASAAAAARLASLGVRGAIVPIFSHLAAVHDAVAGRSGALVDAICALRGLAAAGLKVAVEIPLLPLRLQQLEQVVAFAHQAAGALAEARFRVPRHPQPAALAPPRWAEARAPLAAALRACRERRIAVALAPHDGIPLCVLGHEPGHGTVYRFDPRRPLQERSGFARAAACAPCAMRRHCAGPSEAYRAAHGEADLVPFERRPRELAEQRTTPRRTWQPHQREAARRVWNRVLRPTLACNQRCPFCSANETSQEAIAEPSRMIRRVARLARQGIEHLSFSGGEPTLCPDLPRYVRVASRLGVKAIEVVTNGVALASAERVRALREAGLTNAFVSLHGHDDAVASRSTGRAGDFARTVQAIHHLLAAGVRTDVNHVVSALNAEHLPRFAAFVADELGGAVGVSFAFVTPQHRALEAVELVPRMTEVLPALRAAMELLERRGVRFVVGSRQGLPPCLLGEHAARSDVFDLYANARSEDEPQKVRGPRCDACRYARQCTGVWRAYAERYGLHELDPVPGSPISDEEARALASLPKIGDSGAPPAARSRSRAP
jgi:MoaA/NifB/PqqE/SkfB family radical SAM enzyme